MNEIQTSVSVAQNPNVFFGDNSVTGGGQKQSTTLFLVVGGIAVLSAVVLIFIFGRKAK